MMWPFTRAPREPRFKIGERVFFNIIEGANFYAGRVVGHDIKKRGRYLVEFGLWPDRIIDVDESYISASCVDGIRSD